MSGSREGGEALLRWPAREEREGKDWKEEVRREIEERERMKQFLRRQEEQIWHEMEEREEREAKKRELELKERMEMIKEREEREEEQRRREQREARDPRMGKY